MDSPITPSKASFIKTLYLYLVSFVALMMIVFPAADIINTTLRTYIFTKADKNFYSYPEVACPTPAPATDSSTPKGEPCMSKEERMKMDEDNLAAQRQRDLVRDISFFIVGIPLFAFHWRLARRKE